MTDSAQRCKFLSSRDSSFCSVTSRRLSDIPRYVLCSLFWTVSPCSFTGAGSWMPQDFYVLHCMDISTAHVLARWSCRCRLSRSFESTKASSANQEVMDVLGAVFRRRMYVFINRLKRCGLRGSPFATLDTVRTSTFVF